MDITLQELQNYLKELEQKVILQGYSKGYFGKIRAISVKDGKLNDSSFGEAIGNVLDSDDPVAIDYYGLIKRSRGFYERLKSIEGGDGFLKIKSLNIPVIHFASIKMAHITEFAPELINNFHKIKTKIVSLRGF